MTGRRRRGADRVACICVQTVLDAGVRLSQTNSANVISGVGQNILPDGVKYIYAVKNGKVTQEIHRHDSQKDWNL